MSNTEQCRDIKELNPLVQLILNKALQEIKANGITPLVVETYRSQERQNYLYCQGRKIVDCTAKGINTSFAKAYCSTNASKVTWTLDSAHTSRKAVDVIFTRNGKAVWSTTDKDMLKVISIMQKWGFENGSEWKTNKDYPHNQIKGDYITTFYDTKTTKAITKMIQRQLNAKLGLNLKVDGNWGEKTTDAVNQFRSKYGWEKDGKVGTATFKKLIE